MRAYVSNLFCLRTCLSVGRAACCALDCLLALCFIAASYSSPVSSSHATRAEELVLIEVLAPADEALAAVARVAGRAAAAAAAAAPQAPAQPTADGSAPAESS